VKNTKTIEQNFYMFARMAGIEQPKPNKFDFDDEVYQVEAYVSPEIAAAFGGRNRAFKLLRYAQMIEHVCSNPDNRHLIGIVDKSFDEVSRKHPILRSHYEAARIGGYQFTFMRRVA
jgi:hypothetical protein